MAYYGGWVTAISQLGFGLGFLFTLVVGGLFIVIGDVQVLDWAFQVVVYLVAALAAGKVSDRAFEASGVDL